METRRPCNFSAGPAAIPEEVLKQAAADMLDWHGSGMSVMEMSHRGKEFISIYEQAEADLRELLAVPTHFKILFMQGGGQAENAIVPLNLSRGTTADFVITGSWSQKSLKEAHKYCTANIAKANLFYNFIDHSQLYVNKVAPNCRSRMNVPFFLRNESRNDAFLASAKTRGLLQLKGHKSVGGMRASIYNAMPIEGVQALVDSMREFERIQS